MDESLSQALARIQAEWSMTNAEMARLAQIPEAVYKTWLTRGDESATIPSGMDNAVPLVRIHQILARWFPAAEEQLKWLSTPHKDFGGNRPVDIAATSPERLQWLAYYLETFREKPAAN
ncbi:MAG: antitoxin Xre/MbcA/ParS toxin-binding domain-containing protein [Bdellovibrionota bacterium]